ncbi:MAG: agglutinin biogenesis protein MshI [Burkholderiales bacterium]|nr:agglutinin biogenesis protein MshI [Burkholderiales bacterium]
MTVHGHTVELAQVERTAGARPKITAFRKVDTDGANPDALVALRRQYRLDRRRVTTLLPPGAYQIQLVEAPNVPEAELKTAIRWKLKDVLDYPPEQATVDVLPLPMGHVPAGRPRQLFAVSARNDQVSARMRVFEAARVPLVCIDVPELAQRNVAALFEEAGRSLALLAFNEYGGILTITAGGELLLARSLDVPLSQLEVQGDGAAGLFERVGLELQRSLDHFDRQFGGLQVGRLLLAPFRGMQALQRFLADNLYLPVEVLDLAGVLDFDRITELATPEAQGRSLQLLGAALRDAA